MRGKQFSVWKREAESCMEELFGAPKEKTDDGSDELQRLRAKVGELTMERYKKKKSNSRGR